MKTLVNLNHTGYEDNWLDCTKCGDRKIWYRFPFPLHPGKPIICFTCQSQRSQLDERLKVELEKIWLEKRIKRLINTAMANKMSDLREHLFDALKAMKKNEIDIPTAKSICEISQVIINSVKVEVEAIKVMGPVKKNEFLELESSD